MPPRLFVYGTLRSEFNNRFARKLRASSKLIGPARMRGRLYRFDWYPGLRRSRSADQWVSGELYLLKNAATLLAELDTYEGFAFNRVRSIARDSRGRSAPTWVYEIRAAPPESRRIASGEFIEKSSTISR